jgi:RNase P subunit RPR2
VTHYGNVEDRPGDGIARIWVTRKTRELRLFMIARIRKAAYCAKCRRLIGSGTDAYRQMTNGADRMDRLCVACVESVSTLSGQRPADRTGAGNRNEKNGGQS